tara:strand:- start:894 stop:1457 length:564 start_codon:yes stop_codon:yes gene_type:complete
VGNFYDSRGIGIEQFNSTNNRKENKMTKQVENKKELSLEQIVTALANHSTFKTSNDKSSYFSAEVLLNTLCWKAGSQVDYKQGQLIEASEKLAIETTQVAETGVRADNTHPSEVVTKKASNIAIYMQSVKDELDTWTEAQDTFKKCYKQHTGKDFIPSAKGSAPVGLADNKQIKDLQDFVANLRKSA